MRPEILTRISEKLRSMKQIPFEIEDNTLYVFPLDDQGFAVWFETTEEGYRVGFNGWHEEFKDSDTALECFAFGLSPNCRLKEINWGRRPYRWTVLCKYNNRWDEASSIKLRMVPFWRKRSEKLLQNHFFSSTNLTSRKLHID